MRASQVFLGVVEKARAGPGLGLTRLSGVRRLQILIDRLLALLERKVAAEGTEIDVFGFRLAVDLTDRQTAATLLRTGTYEPAEIALFSEVVTPGMTVVDIGANIGIYTLIAARSVGATGNVFAFEPGPRSAALLRRSVAANGLTNVVVEELAVARATGNAELFLVENHPGLSSLNAANARGSAQSVPVKTVSLDAYFADIEVDVIKIDVQGAETEIVLGASRMLERDRPVVFAEVWLAGLENVGSDGREFLSLFTNAGYTIANVERPDELLSIDETLRLASPAGGLDVVLRP
jgi:FkbM family methyltransferase